MSTVGIVGLVISAIGLGIGLTKSNGKPLILMAIALAAFSMSFMTTGNLRLVMLGGTGLLAATMFATSGRGAWTSALWEIGLAGAAVALMWTWNFYDGTRSGDNAFAVVLGLLVVAFIVRVLFRVISPFWVRRSEPHLRK